jgi:STE24 endopeptidase
MAMVLVLGLWSRGLARRVATDHFHRSLRRFNQTMIAARLMVPAWFAIGVWALGWGSLLLQWGEPFYRSAPGLLLGTLPAFAAWMGLWWSQYPAERALREQNLLIDLDNGVPLYQPISFRRYFASNFRLQVLFTLLPVVMIVLVRDGLMWIAAWMLGPIAAGAPPYVEMVSMLLSAAAVFLFAPALLRRILNTSPMPASPLRERLDALCRRAGVRYRQILVWNTHNHVGNAAVMGVLPRLRYVLLSDVLLERMTDEQIEAVFAHELGHIVHRHMTWYAIFFVVLILLISGLGTVLTPYIHALSAGSATEGVIGSLFIVAFFLLFGALSRRCERQADVYAARTIEMLKAEEPLTSQGLFAARQLVTVGAGPLSPLRSARRTHVGRHGAGIFASALRRVAIINNIPINPRTRSGSGFWNRVAHWLEEAVELCNNWLHGSIAGRMQYLQDLSADPRLTGHFDRTMYWLFCGLLFALFTSAIFSALQSLP